ncbi:MAG TPA: TonB-dependent receptor plug domain-containing protein, partial [Opitutaceae bacterium]
MKSPISSFGPHVRRLLGGAGVATSLAVLAGANLSAQSSPEEGAADDVVTLQEFSVTTSATSEYVAAESITGTRVATKLRDLPFTVNVVTSDFLDDFAAFEFREQLSYTSSVVGYETISTGYMVRGVDANVQLRNGFRRIGLIDKVSVERIEVIKGAAASIYGTVMPGGTVNIITKKPKTKPENRIGFSVGSNNLLRGQASSTGPVGSSDKVFYRVDVAADTTEYDLEYKKKDQQTIVGSMLWKLKPTTSLLVEYEYLKRDEIGNASIPFIRSRAVDPYR